MRELYPDNNFVPPLMRHGDRLMVGEAPGLNESEQGEPFVGTSGAWLRGRYDEERQEWKGGLLKRAGIEEKNVSITNTICCRPPNNVYPTDPDAKSYISREEGQRALDHCFNAHLEPVLLGRPWTRIDVLGDKALRAVCEKDGGIMRWRGSPLPVPVIDPTRPLAVPTIHPAALARDQGLIPAVVSDLKKGLILAPEHYSPHATLDEVKAFDATTFAFDIETSMVTGEIICVGLSDRLYHAICVPFKGAYLVELKRIFRAAHEVIGHNLLQFDLPRMRDADVVPGNPSAGGHEEFVQVWDTMLMQHLLQPDLPHSLGFLGSIFVAKPAWKHESGADLELYCCRDVDVTYQCWRQLKPLLAQENLLNLYRTVSVPLARICYDMHRTGIQVDPSRIGAVRDSIIKEMSQLEQALPESLRSRQVPVRRRSPAPPGTLSEKTGKPIRFLLQEVEETEIPWRSPDVVSGWLYGLLGLPTQLHVKTQEPTVDKTAVVKLLRIVGRRVDSDDKAAILRALKALSRLRQLNTLETSFCKEELLVTQRLHPSFNVHGTSSGRLSSSDPNVQNIPESARFIYVPSQSDFRFLEVDYSSIENRLTAWFAGDQERLARWALDPSYNEHKAVASAFFGIPYEMVEKDNDRDAPYGKAKRINHGSNYAMGPKKISNLYDMDFREVRDLCQKWRDFNAATVRWQADVAAQAKKQGYLVTPFGRKRWFYTDSAYTESISFLPQSTAADIIFRAMIALRPLLPTPARIVLQVHDSLLIEFPGALTDEVVALVRRVMETPVPEIGNMTIPIEMKLTDPGSSWGEAKKFNPKS